MPALDRYETDVLDDDEYDNISQTERAAAEAAMRRRDREEGVLTRRGDLELIYGMHCIILLQTHIIVVFLNLHIIYIYIWVCVHTRVHACVCILPY
jgi:hypothetical protein